MYSWIVNSKTSPCHGLVQKNCFHDSFEFCPLLRMPWTDVFGFLIFIFVWLIHTLTLVPIWFLLERICVSIVECKVRIPSSGCNLNYVFAFFKDISTVIVRWFVSLSFSSRVFCCRRRLHCPTQMMTLQKINSQVMIRISTIYYLCTVSSASYIFNM